MWQTYVCSGCTRESHSLTKVHNGNTCLSLVVHVLLIALWHIQVTMYRLTSKKKLKYSFHILPDFLNQSESYNAGKVRIEVIVTLKQFESQSKHWRKVTIVIKSQIKCGLIKQTFPSSPQTFQNSKWVDLWLDKTNIKCTVLQSSLSFCVCTSSGDNGWSFLNTFLGDWFWT